MARDPVYMQLINSTAWRRLRNVHLSCHPLCEDCRRRGVVRAATEVHHIQPVESGRTPEEKRRLAYLPSNLRSLCRDCHRETHRIARKGTREERERRVRAEAEEFVKLFCRKRDPGG